MSKMMVVPGVAGLVEVDGGDEAVVGKEKASASQHQRQVHAVARVTWRRDAVT